MKGHFREEQLPMNNAWKIFVSPFNIRSTKCHSKKRYTAKERKKNFQASLYTSNDNQADENKNLRPNEGAK